MGNGLQCCCHTTRGGRPGALGHYPLARNWGRAHVSQHGYRCNQCPTASAGAAGMKIGCAEGLCEQDTSKDYPIDSDCEVPEFAPHLGFTHSLKGD